MKTSIHIALSTALIFFVGSGAQDSEVRPKPESVPEPATLQYSCQGIALAGRTP